MRCAEGRSSHIGLCCCLTMPVSQRVVVVNECAVWQNHNKRQKLKLSICTAALRSRHWESGISVQVFWCLWSFNFTAFYQGQVRPDQLRCLPCWWHSENHHGRTCRVLCVRSGTCRSLQNVPVLLLYIRSMCNALLLQGCLPQSKCYATVLHVPRLKKANADHTDVKNYQPVSSLTFMSKVRGVS